MLRSRNLQFVVTATTLFMLAMQSGVQAQRETSRQDRQTEGDGQDGRRAAVRRHMRALEQAGASELSRLLANFDQSHFSQQFKADTTVQQRRDLLETVRTAAAQANNIQVNVRNDTVVLELAGDRHYRVTFQVQEQPPFAINQLGAEVVSENKNGIALNRGNLAETFRRLESQGFSGVVFVKLGGETVLQRAYGVANEELGYQVKLDTVFGIGSTPIDFTVAAILLLAQQGQIKLDDKIANYFDEVPDDKREMTILHLLQGRSGLPDFHHNSEDWDADLAWIDRSSAVRRILHGSLRFPPGTGRASSHSAFGLLAALVEQVSGQSYIKFLRQSFFQPAGMTRTGMNGDSLGLTISEFAVGGGPSVVGLPNIPPNWGPTSWLVLGSGGMCSTLGDMLRFYDFVRSGQVLKPEFARRFTGAGANLDGSDRGFEKFHCYKGIDNEAMLMTNSNLNAGNLRDIFSSLEKLIETQP